MNNNSLFIVIEGLDGSGKTSVARQLTYFLQSSLKKNIKLTFEPHDASCGGLYIRQVLEKKISDFSPKTLALAFAANRMDHCDREIDKWLAEGEEAVVVCDRYYLSSLVYQSDDDFSMDDVMNLNEYARKPDIIFFMNVSNEVCYQRMKIRNKPQELFETNLSKTREKYFKAIDFLEENRKEKVVLIDANGTIKSVLKKMVAALSDFGLKNNTSLKSLEWSEEFQLKEAGVFELNDQNPSVLEVLISNLQSYHHKSNADANAIKTHIDSFFENFELSELGTLFLNYLESLNYKLLGKILWTQLDAYELEYRLPGGILQRGTALLIREPQRYDVILESVSKLGEMTDFMFVFAPGPSSLVTKYYERDMLQYSDKQKFLFPSTQLITEDDLKDKVFEKCASFMQ